MKNKQYTLRELSEDLDVSIRDLKIYIRKGVLKAKKVGRAYVVAISDLDNFIDERFPTRNYMCQRYDRCLDKAARANTEFNCAKCHKSIQSNIPADKFFMMESGLSAPLVIN